MNYDELHFCTAAALLKQKPSTRHKSFELLEKGFPKYYSEVRTPGSRGVGFKLLNGTEVSFIEYLKDLEATEITVSRAQADSHELPDYILSAFAQESKYVLNFKVQGKQKSFYQTNFRSPEYLLDQQKLAGLLEAIPSQKTALSFIAEQFNRNFELNEIPKVEESEIIPFLKQGKFPKLYGDEVPKILTEIQKSLKFDEKTFAIVGEWANLIEQSQGGYGMFKDVGYFLPEAEISHFVSFINAQDGANDLWDLILADLNQFLETPLTKETFLTAEKYNIPSGNILRAVDDYLSQNGKTVKIPADVDPVLQWGAGPKDLIERKKWIPDEDRWIAKRNPSLYEVNWLEEFTGTMKHFFASEEAVKEFKSALVVIEDFAKRNNSIFTEAFSLARWVMERPLSYFDRVESIQESHQKDLVAAGFSEQALSVYQSRLDNVLFLLEPFGTKTQVQMILATDIANVFGGMGSWNDQNFDGEEYHSVSSEMFKSIKGLVLLAINS